MSAEEKTRLPPNRWARPRGAGGFTLLEVMVGLAVASVSLLLIMQSLLLFEEQKRATVSSDDAETVGAIGFYVVQRDVRQSGYGISALDLVGCDVVLPPEASEDRGTSRGEVTLSAMAPVTINAASIPPGDPNTDTLLIVYGNGYGEPAGTSILPPALAGAKEYALESAFSFSEGDRVIAEPAARPAPCSLSLDRVESVGEKKVAVEAGAAADMSDGRLFNLGHKPKILAYAIRGGSLTQCDFMANDCTAAGGVNDPQVWMPVASNIVSLRAQYGRDTSPSADAILDVYDQAAPVTNCGWVRIGAVRLVLVARNNHPEKTEAAPAAPAWAGGAAAPVDLNAAPAADGFTWKNYRYKTFESVISIRNIAQSGVQEGC